MAAYRSCCIEARLRKSYHEYMDDFIILTEGPLDVLGLSNIPHFTTIEEFVMRVPGTLLERVLGG